MHGSFTGVFSTPGKFDIHLLGLPQEMSLVLLEITDYIYSS